MPRTGSRRDFLTAAVASCTAAPFLLQPQSMDANPLNLPIGLQLYTVGAEMDKDPFGTLKRVAEVGYKEVELSPLSKTPAPDLLRGLHDNGLTSPSGHFMLPDLMSNLQKNIDAAKQFGQEYMIVTVPWIADPSRLKSSSGGDQMAFFLALLNSLTLDDWKWNAEQFNKVGEQIKKAGLQLGYHNHNFEFKSYGAGHRVRRIHSAHRSGAGEIGTRLWLDDGRRKRSRRVPQQISRPLPSAAYQRLPQRLHAAHHADG